MQRNRPGTFSGLNDLPEHWPTSKYALPMTVIELDPTLCVLRVIKFVYEFEKRLTHIASKVRLR
jgi:hypothetical protein